MTPVIGSLFTIISIVYLRALERWPELQYKLGDLKVGKNYSPPVKPLLLNSVLIVKNR